MCDIRAIPWGGRGGGAPAGGRRCAQRTAFRIRDTGVAASWRRLGGAAPRQAPSPRAAAPRIISRCRCTARCFSSSEGSAPWSTPSSAGAIPSSAEAAGERDGGPEPRSSTQRLRRERPTMAKGAVSERESKRRAEAPVVRREWPERRHVERACVGHAPMTAPIRHASGSQWHARALHGRQATCLSRKPHGCWPVGHTRSLAASSR